MEDVRHILEELVVLKYVSLGDRCNHESSAKSENGGFPHPRDCSKCICPSGYGGEPAMRAPSGCGKILTAASEYQELRDLVGRKDYDRNDENDDFDFFDYWIEVCLFSTAVVQ
ncbi:Astacin (Peptidase M12A) [Parelaphostrongylus tenuis]|uniref:Astacin (Peptidase M12A) n=1 Tax=Parelaphostrongylus tenuis TaxID=148309 RepID=A0AAD5MXB4_PARTN|nr:Astacin (Peptidase M12A) [Parelaphostrongylus tenuis]